LNGGYDPADEEYFDQCSEDLINTYVVPGGFTAARVYQNPSALELETYRGDEQDVIDEINAGKVLINYIGHASGTSWNLLHQGSISSLHNAGMLPFATSYSCGTGDFVGIDGFGELLLESPEKGTIGFWGATGVGWKYGNSYLNEEFFKSVFLEGRRCIGQIVTEARINFFLQHPLYEDLMQTYTLTGDPTTLLALPE
ncbi:MAG: hypothetical protein HY801_05550, partial [Candidatus Lindowbacteria bacterium]|nr:hypothetical protein [Candidatus Lindowbacteria bacterium]